MFRITTADLPEIFSHASCSKKHSFFKLSIASVLLFTLCLVFSGGCFKTQELKWSIQCALVGQLTLTQAGTAHCVSASALKVFCNHVAVMAKSGEYRLCAFLCISEHFDTSIV